MTFEHQNKSYQVNSKKGHDLSIPLSGNSKNPTAWYVAPPSIEAVRNEQFVGAVKEGGAVNFRSISFNPHGHGTHTECVGHISETVYSVNKVLRQFFFLAELISVEPEIQPNGDQIISKKNVTPLLSFPQAEALIIRTFPNTKEKLSRQYSNTNPPYVEASLMKTLIERGIQHFLIDLPSVDRENDGGELSSHCAFWEYPETLNLERTITELIYVDDSISDGLYLLNLQLASFENDASPSKPVIYPLSNR